MAEIITGICIAALGLLVFGLVMVVVLELIAGLVGMFWGGNEEDDETDKE